MTALPQQSCQTSPESTWWRLRAEWLYTSILSGELADHDRPGPVVYPLSVDEIGVLELPGGRFVGADPYVMGGSPAPFEQSMTSNQADVVAVRAHIGPGHRRIAALVLISGRKTVADWHIATISGQDVAALGGEAFYGYGVDAGTGSFGSVPAMTVAARVLHADAGMLDDPISKALFADGIGTESAVVIAPEAGADVVAACSSGWGDGTYPTWLGTSDSGDVVIALTDFLLTGDPHAAPVESAQNAMPTASDAPEVVPRKPLIKRIFNR